MFKLLRNTVVIGLVSSALIFSTANSGETRTVTLTVENMTCALCPLTVRKSLEKVDGVIKAEASYDTKTATVTFDPVKTTIDALTKATTDAGYPSRLKE